MWMVPLTIVIAFSSTLGLLAPKASPQWPDPVPFLTSMSDKGENGPDGNGKMGRIGYGTNDSQLGGPFEFDYKEVFTATIKERHYWRVETKDTYTGKGWENSMSSDPFLLNKDNVEYQAPKTMLIEPDGAKMEKQKTSIKMKKTYPFIVSPGVITSIDAKNGVDFEIDPLTGKINTFSGKERVNLKNYMLDYELPQFDEKKLRESDQSYPIYVTDAYLQLPKELPKRVKKLAANIVKDADNPYDKAKAVESYFAINNFGYDTTDVRPPKKDQDYVDQFLFKAKKGYCDNFSTSMIVLLRSAGIPARWVKGFTFGEYQSTKGEYRTYKVTNANAHSWPEVYFSGIGWVPFEPTRGFSNPNSFQQDEKSSTPAAAVPVKKPKKQEVQPDQNENSAKDQNGGDGLFFMLSAAAKYAVVVLVVIGVLALVFRKKWLRQYYIWKFRRRKGPGTFADAYHRLLWLTQTYGLKRNPAFTLREYASYVDRSLDTRDMKILTSAYESLQYSNNNNADYWTETNRKLWENLIKKLRG